MGQPVHANNGDKFYFQPLIDNHSDRHSLVTKIGEVKDYSTAGTSVLIEKKHFRWRLVRDKAHMAIKTQSSLPCPFPIRHIGQSVARVPEFRVFKKRLFISCHFLNEKLPQPVIPTPFPIKLRDQHAFQYTSDATL